MRGILITLLLSCSLFLSAEDTIPSLNLDQLEIIGLNELTLSSFQEETAPLNFENMELKHKTASWVLFATGNLVFLSGVLIDVGAFGYMIVRGIGGANGPDGYSIGEGAAVISAFIVGTVLIVWGVHILHKYQEQRPANKSSKQKQLDSIKKFEGY